MELKTVKYEPSCCEKGVLSGHVVLKKPSVDDLLKGSAIAKQGKDDELGSTSALIEWSKKFYSEIKLKNIDGSKYETFEDLLSDGECLAVLSDVAVALVVGINTKKLEASKREIPS